MKILITAGPTSEFIDSVRKITNTSTGSLGVEIANELLKIEDVEITFLAGEGSKLPNGNINIENFISTNDAYKYMEANSKHFDVIIHSAAIADYRIGGVFTMMSNGELDEVGFTGKLSSDEECYYVKMERNIKIVDYIKEWNPNAILISFKLLDDVTAEELISVARKQLERTNSDYVIANDLTNIGDNHKAYIVSKSDVIEKKTKAEIAKGIYNILHFPEFSVQFNPLYGLSNEEIASMVSTIVPAKKNKG